MGNPQKVNFAIACKPADQLNIYSYRVMNVKLFVKLNLLFAKCNFLWRHRKNARQMVWSDIA
ncbi:hypothetical protein OSCI_230007 [Kamptonema sp. PCC 6506]|nr:hypothetical protein OSCI_230007 [Kamptonema sp. PCC 6506]